MIFFVIFLKGFADFLRQVGNRPDAFGPADFNDKNDRLVADDIDDAIRQGIYFNIIFFQKKPRPEDNPLEEISS
jgi:hypothetical protein